MDTKRRVGLTVWRQRSQDSSQVDSLSMIVRYSMLVSDQQGLTCI